MDANEGKDKNIALKNLIANFDDFEIGIRLLAGIYDDNSPFWQTFKSLKKGYFETVLREKELSLTKPQISENLFKELAIGKSLICHNSVYAIQYLANDSSFEKELVSCLNHIHIAFQLLDDIDDFKKDIQEGQWTYPQSLLRDYCKSNDLVIDNHTNSYKYLFISGIAEQLVHKAIENYTEGLKSIEELPLNSIKQFIEEQIKSCKFYLDEVSFLFQKSRILAGKSFELIKTNSINASIKSSLRYLKDCQNEDGTWSDFMTSAGTSLAWTTGYVGMNIAECFPDAEILHETKETLATNQESFLSYNDSILQDGDSTTFVIGLCDILNIDISNILYQWHAFRVPSGAWVTYLHENLLRKRLDLPPDISVDAWLSPKLCVSSAAALILSKLEEPYFDETINFIISNQEPLGFWNSYWWTSPIYATSYTIMALKDSLAYQKQVDLACEWILSIQKDNGSWLNPATKTPNAFYTALASKALLSCKNKKYYTHIDSSVSWLLQNQTTDGSWLTDRILQIPATDIENPVDVQKWRNSSFGVNCITDDHNRVFTTSAVLNFLATYQKQRYANY